MSCLSLAAQTSFRMQELENIRAKLTATIGNTNNKVALHALLEDEGFITMTARQLRENLPMEESGNWLYSFSLNGLKLATALSQQAGYPRLRPCHQSPSQEVFRPAADFSRKIILTGFWLTQSEASQMNAIANLLRNTNYQVNQAVALVAEESAISALAKNNIKLHNLFTAEHLIHA